MDWKHLRELYTRYHLSEQIGILSSLAMTVISLFPLIRSRDSSQAVPALFFGAIFVLRLVLYLWNLRVRDSEEAYPSRIRMMFTAGALLLIAHGGIQVTIIYQMIQRKTVPLMASRLTLAIVYGAYAFVRIVVSIYGLHTKKRVSLYHETLSYIGWITAVYSLALFTDYILIANGAPDTFKWPKYAMIAAMGVAVFSLSAKMIVKSLWLMKKNHVKLVA